MTDTMHTKVEEPDSAPVKTDGSADYSSNGTSETVQAEVPADTVIHEVPETVSPEKKNRLPLKIGGALAAGALVVTGAIAAFGGGEDSADKRIETPSADAPSQPATQNPNINQTPETLAPKTYGNINLSTIDLGPNPITATRPNGEQIRVPSLDNSSSQRLGVTALDLIACYMTTGDEKCLNGFSKNPAVQKTLIDWRQRDVVPMLSNPRYPNNKNFQQAIFDSPSNPAVFTDTNPNDSRQIVELTAGALYFGRHINPAGSNEWQGEETRRAGGLEQQIHKLKFYVMGSGPNATIDGFEWDIQLVKS